MSSDELSEITRLIGIEEAPESQELLLDIVSGWLAREVKQEGRSQDEVERSVLEWVAKSWNLIVAEESDTNDLERALRLKMAQDASELLAPGWAICCALIAVGKESNITTKLDLMERATSITVPSSRARRAKREEWNALCQRWVKNEPSSELEPYVERLSGSLELQTECLTLGLALSLLDGKIEFPTEQLYRRICDLFEMSRADSDAIKAKVNNLYWKHHNEAEPTQNKDERKVNPIHLAAKRTVYGAGALEALAAEARERLFGTVMPEEKKKTGWSKLVGGFSGMSGFFSKKTNNSTDATLARIVYHAILKQHDAIVMAAAMAHSGLEKVVSKYPEPLVIQSKKPETPESNTSQAISPQHPVGASTQESMEQESVALDSTPSLSEQMIDTSKPTNKRIIKLDL